MVILHMHGGGMSEQAEVIETLSKRELEVAAAYADGASYKEIARDLGISPTTVRSHLRTVYSKLNVTSKIALAQMLTEPDEVAAPPADEGGLTADLALELDEAIRRERMMADVLKLINRRDTSLEEVIDALLDHALEICESQFGQLFEYHGDLTISEMRSRGIPDAFAKWLKKHGKIKLSPYTAVGRMIETLEIVHIADVRGEGPEYQDNAMRVATAELGKARSFVAIPIISGGNLIGAFTVYRTRVHPFNDRALELAQAFADQAAIAIENTRHYAAIEARLGQAAATREILEAISSASDDEGPVFETILRNAAKLCSSPMARLELVDRQNNTFHCAAAWGDEMRSFKVGEVLPLDSENDLPTAIREGVVRHIHDLSKTELYLSGEPTRVRMVEDEGYRTYLVVPLIAKGVSIGGIVLSRREVDPFSEENIALLKTFAAQAVIALENVRQFRDLQKRLELEAAISHVLGAISASREDDIPVFHTILENACRVCDTQSGFIVVVDESGEHLKGPAQFGVGEEFASTFDDWSAHLATSPLGAARCIRERRSIPVDDIANTDLYREGNVERVRQADIEGMHSIVCVPLLTPDAGLGSMVLYRKEVQPFTAEEITMLEAFAAQAVIAIENAQQFRALQDRTAEVQSLNASLEAKVDEQVGEIARMGQLKQFMSPAVADALVSSGDEKALSSHRALIATLFCDIRGFTAFCETAEPEETIEVLQAYHEQMGQLISAHGGGVDKRMGDGIMVIFNDPLPCDDPAGDAVRLSLAMHASMKELCAKWKKLGHRLGFGVGVSFGYATVGMVGSEGRFDYTASGTSVNTAARLSDLAEDGETLLSPRAWAAVEGDVKAESRGEISIKGIREPVEVFAIVE